MIEKQIFNIKKSIISVIYVLLAYLLLITIFKGLEEIIDKRSLLIGLLSSVCNFYVILWAWSRIFLKKRIALAIGVIVIKYAILGIIIYSIVSNKEYDIISFLVGMFSIVLIVISYSLLLMKRNKQR